MATTVLITVDTELSAGRQARGWSARDNFESSITGLCAAGAYGVGWQLDRLEAHGLRGVYFVDPMPALVHGEQIIADIVGPIVARGHEVQLHIHTEWLEWAKAPPVSVRGRNIGDFSRDDQRVLLSMARDLLVAAGAPHPAAFRAGNYGANDDTIAVLAELGFRWDASVNPAYLGRECRISADPGLIGPTPYRGLMLVPVSGLEDLPGRFRPAQICAISTGEMRAALRHAGRSSHPCFSIVTHSFEMLARDRQRPNAVVTRRFEAMCAAIAHDPNLQTGGFDGLDPRAVPASATRLRGSYVRTGVRLAEQAWATLRYERGEGM